MARRASQFCNRSCVASRLCTEQHKKRQEKTLGEENNGSNNMSGGLEMVQVQFQQVLDAFIQKKISAKEMKSQVEWETR